MVEKLQTKSIACRKAVQYLVAIIVTLIIGKLVADIPLFANTVLFHSLTSGELVSFVTKMAVLVLIFVFTRSVINAMDGNGSGVSFLRGIAVPLASLLIVVIAQQSIRDLLSPFLETPGNSILTMFSSAAVFATAFWLIYAFYRYSPLLFDYVMFLGKELRSQVTGTPSTRTCLNCGCPLADHAKYCPSCGTEFSEMRCRHCHAMMFLPAKYCSQCGSSQQTESN